jgi:hypothetical protein
VKLCIAALLVTCTSFVAGCGGDPDFKPITNAPPGAVAELRQDKSKDTASITISEGLAMAVECVDSKQRPCSFDGTVIDDATIATFRRAYADLDQKVVYNAARNEKSHLDRTVFVVTGKKVGRTTLTVRTGRGDVPITVDVLEATK